MNFSLRPGMSEATNLVRNGRVTEATELLQRLLQNPPSSPAPVPTAAPPQARPTGRITDIDPTTGDPVAHHHAPTPAAAQFAAHSHAGPHGTRPYKLFIPQAAAATPRPLIVMLHGCTQSPDDFAAGTGMNRLAEAHGCLVAYPGQPQSANAQKCWNWFNPADQQRGRGEPALIAGIAHDIMARHAIDPSRIYIAGLSAGGAAAAVMGAAYPDLFAAVGIHSGLPCGAARDMPSAFAAMRNGPAATPPGNPTSRGPVPTIVFHADKDATVNPRNADHIIAQSGAGAGLHATVTRGQVPGGHAFTRSVHAGADGRPMLEQWLIHGGGHAWSGGNPAGTYTDPRGPDASREMLRFFLQHRLA